jgi:hypothetical protein
MIIQKSQATDPFGEFSTTLHRQRLQLLGGSFQFEVDHRPFLRLVEAAYAGLPRHRMGQATPRFRIRLRLSSQNGFLAKQEPPTMHMHSGAGLLCGSMDASNFAALSLDTCAGLVVISRRMLERFPYHARYELLEFAVFTLASRVQGLVPLHAGCVGLQDRGVLLIGDSGAGKSTLALHCLMQGLDFLSEDATFVAPDTLLATGVANFLHVRKDSLRFLKKEAATLQQILESPVIRRRSGEKKFEIDLRRTGYRLAPAAQKICAIVCLSKRNAGGGPLLTPLRKSELRAKLSATQPYAARQLQWLKFIKQTSGIGVFELRRGRHPVEAVDALRRLLE